MSPVAQSTLSALLFLFLLGGCSIFPSSNTKCIKTVLVSSVSKMPLSRVKMGDRRDVIISAFKGGCGGSSPQLPGGSDDIGLTLTLTVPEAKRPTGQTKEVALPLFVALLDKEDNVKDRLDEMVKVTLSDHALNHTHKIIYHLPEGIDVDNQNYSILVGFNAEIVPTPVLCSKPIESLKTKKTPLRTKKTSLKTKKNPLKKKHKKIKRKRR